MKFILIFLIAILGLNVKVLSQIKPDIEKIDDAVVLVLIYDYYGSLLGHGSGFIIDSKGIVATNYHVIKGAHSLKVRLDRNGTKTDYNVNSILSGDEHKDLAKISIENPNGVIFPFLNFAKTKPNKGDDCWAIGTPADPIYMNTVSKGLVSNIDFTSSPKTLQTNAEITHGSSGGALLNSRGEVIGITSAGDETKDGSRASINFAIWIDELYNLPAINKKSIIDPKSIPCQLSFYTNNPYTGFVYLYIDGYYVGSFSKYFQNNYTPKCGEEGTITRYLYSGTHTCQVYNASLNMWSQGQVILEPGECQVFRVNETTGTTGTTNSKNNNTSPKGRAKSVNAALGLFEMGNSNNSSDAPFNIASNKNNSITLTIATKQKRALYKIGYGKTTLGTITIEKPLVLTVDKNQTYYFEMYFENRKQRGWHAAYSIRTGSDNHTHYLVVD
jgi:hypothetical protein